MRTSNKTKVQDRDSLTSTQEKIYNIQVTYSDRENSTDNSSSLKKRRIRKWYLVWPCFKGGFKLTCKVRVALNQTNIRKSTCASEQHSQSSSVAPRQLAVDLQQSSKF